MSTPMPKRRARHCRKHSIYRRGCYDCGEWTRYQAALRRRDKREGKLELSAPASTVQAYLRDLTDPQVGGWRIKEIAAVTGISHDTLSRIMNGGRSTVRAINWNAIRVLSPKGTPVPARAGRIDATETRRIMQGLAAQGWSFNFMGSVVGRDEARIRRLAHASSLWVEPQTLDMARILRDKLGPYDINELPRPLPGMNRYCANIAADKGWAPLHDWDGLDITDPAVEPFRADPDLEAETVAGRALIDMATVRRLIVHMDFTARGKTNRLEAYAAVAVGSMPGPDGKAALSATDLGDLLGYPQTTQTDRDNGQRQVTRMRAHLAKIHEWVAGEPTGEAPRWLTAPRKTAGVPNFGNYLYALIAVQPAPFGHGMSPAELADRCGPDVTEVDIVQFLEEGAELAARRWEPMVQRPAKRAKRPTTRAGRAASSGRCAA